MLVKIIGILCIIFAFIGIITIINLIFDNFYLFTDIKYYIKEFLKNKKLQKRNRIIDKYFIDQKVYLNGICIDIKNSKYTYDYLIQLQEKNFDEFLNVCKMFFLYRMLKCYENKKYLDDYIKKQFNLLCDTFIFKKYYIDYISINNKKDDDNDQYYVIHYTIKLLNSNFNDTYDRFYIEKYGENEHICKDFDKYIRDKIDFDIKDKLYRKTFS